MSNVRSEEAQRREATIKAAEGLASWLRQEDFNEQDVAALPGDVMLLVVLRSVQYATTLSTGWPVFMFVTLDEPYPDTDESHLPGGGLVWRTWRSWSALSRPELQPPPVMPAAVCKRFWS